jgi:hypothetical protein
MREREERQMARGEGRAPPYPPHGSCAVGGVGVSACGRRARARPWARRHGDGEREMGRVSTVHLGPCTVSLSLFVFLFFNSILF